MHHYFVRVGAVVELYPYDGETCTRVGAVAELPLGVNTVQDESVVIGSRLLTISNSDLTRAR